MVRIFTISLKIKTGLYKSSFFLEWQLSFNGSSPNWPIANFLFSPSHKKLESGVLVNPFGGSKYVGREKDNVKSVLHQKRNVQILRIALKGNRYIESKLYPNTASGFYSINESNIAI